MSSATAPSPHRAGVQRELRLGLAVLALLAAGALAWAALAPVSGAVIAQGTLRPMAQRVTVLAGTAGVLRQWQLSEGLSVRSGQVLAVLDDPDTLGQRDALGESETSERLRVERLRRLAAWTPGRDGAPPPLAASGDLAGVPAALLEQEQRLLTSSWHQQRAAMDQIEQQHSEAERRAQALERAARADQQALALAREELQRNEKLVEDGFVSATRLLTLQRTVQEAESRVAAQQAALGEARDRLAELNGLRRNEPLRLARDNARDLAEAERRLADLVVRRRAADGRWQKLQVTAPVDGKVVDLRPLGVGSVVAAGQPLLDLLPQQAPLRVQARLRPEDLAEVKPGAKAEVRITAFPSRDTPPLAATVVLVGADRAATPEATGQSAAAGNARPTGDAGFAVWLELAPTALPLAAGMEAEVFITTGARTPLDYWLTPLSRLMRQALRER